MQLTNIARDVGEDARFGRLYLPMQWMREAGLEPQSWLQQPVFDERLAQVVRRLLAAADQLYERAELGIAALPRDCRPAIRAAGLVYAEIGRELERAGLDSVNRRAVVAGSRKLWLVLRAGSAVWSSSAVSQTQLPPLEANRFLVRAAVEPQSAQGRVPPRRTLAQRAQWAAELFERLSVRDQQRAFAQVRRRLPLGQ